MSQELIKPYEILFGAANTLPETQQVSEKEFTTSYMVSDYVAVIPYGREMKFQEKLCKPFHMKTWMSIGVFVILCVVFIIIVMFSASHKSRKFVLGTSATTPLWNLTSLILNGSISSGRQVPTKNFARFMLSMILILLIVIRSSYTGLLFKFVGSTIRINSVENFDDLIEKNYMINFFTEKFAEKFRHVKKSNELIRVPNEEVEREMLLTQMHQLDNSDQELRSAWIWNSDYLLHTNLLEIKRKRVPFNFIDKPVLSEPRFVSVRKNSLLADKLSKVISQLIESGCFEHWKNLYQPNPLMLKKEEEPPKPLTLDMMSGMAYILFGGWISAIIAFIGEKMIATGCNCIELHRHMSFDGNVI